MNTPWLSGTGRILRGLWRVLDGTRRALVNLLLLALVAAALAWLWQRIPTAIEPRTTLVVAIDGAVVEQAGSGLRDAAWRQAAGQGGGRTRLRDVVAVLDAAARDEHITQALLLLDDMGGTGLATLRELAAAVERFKAAGKKVVAWGSGFDQRQYYLAAHASEVWMHPMGMVALEGLGRHRNYYKDALDRLGIHANVVRVGRFKNAAEPFSASAPSEATLENDRAWLGSLWATWTSAVERARKLPAGAVMAYIDGVPTTLPGAGGDTARVALDARLVDALKTRDEMRTLLEQSGARDDEAKTFRQIGLAAYLERVRPERGDDAVGVVVAQGEIVDGKAPPGVIGGLSTAELVRKAREDERVKAVVLRVNSPGGSAFGSELVRHELELTRKAGKPVVVSMGDVAASGGYWISLAADEIIADAGTITGSIGVVAMLPSAREALDRLGVHTGGTTTAWLAGAYDPRRDPDPRFVALVQSVIGRVYDDFLSRASVQRKRTPQQIDALAQGRVYSGADAAANGLVDRVGSFADAVQAAAKRAGLPETARVQYFEVEPGRVQRWLSRLGVHLAAAVAPAIGGGAQAPGGAAPAPALLGGAAADEALADLAWLAGWAGRQAPFAAAVHCLCRMPW